MKHFDRTVTPAMIKAGNDMAGLLMDASVAKCMNGLGGSKTWAEFVGTEIQNYDLVLDYLEERVDSVTVFYLAMERARHSEVRPVFSEPVPESADECEFGDEEYQWRLWQAGL